ncbi:endospore germination permease [Bacillus sp. ISL-40]|uniref:GerAB/ArcD/ProY family transporter n=1 Tax=unclassified Bacillus (in: firmicutes) TaxID=185979 RepID=UPI001BED1080|nr:MULTISPECIES: endospore germination permease [unclassified Bacillus (in: firmicutes)]MBT2700846.1 endospore germination permease [Bacillus sp. ISL-40]MBT2725098.1 endospore germination permease [Bacillus sp. ISL-46]MBT2744390.1 endospore germination permease [Bacillus sp. ISL-77]
MQENGKIAPRQFMIFVILFTIGSSILLLPKFIAADAKQDAWITAMILVGLGLLLAWLYKTLGSLFPDMTLVEYSQKILGRWMGKITSLLFFTYSFFLCAITLRQISNFFVSTMMPETPIEAIHILLLGIVIMGVRYGLENMARTSEIFFPWVLILFFTTVIFVSPQIEFEKIQPVFAKGANPVIRAAFMQLGVPYLELVLFLMIFPYVNRIKEAGKAFFAGSLIGGIIIFSITLLSILVLGAEATENEHVPSYILAQKIDIGEFLQRIEAIMAGLWIITIFFKLQICYYVSALVLAQTLEMRDYRPLTLPFAMILVVLSLVIAPDISYLVNFIANIWTPYSFVFGLYMPLFLFVIAKIKLKFLEKGRS